MARRVIGAALVAAMCGLSAAQSVPTVNCTAPLPGSLADFSATLLNGTTISLAQFVGKVVIVANVATY